MKFKMTVGQLIVALQEFVAEDEGRNGKMGVVLSSSYGDHCRTEQALNIREVGEVDLEESGYSDSGWKVARDGGDDDEPTVALVLRGGR